MNLADAYICYSLSVVDKHMFSLSYATDSGNRNTWTKFIYKRILRTYLQKCFSYFCQIGSWIWISLENRIVLRWKK
jgi:hypothetical protein